MTWFYAKDKHKYGPVTFAELRQLAATGSLLPTDMLLSEGSQQWSAASSIDGLFRQAPPDDIVRLGTLHQMSQDDGSSRGRPWNPTAIAWIGLIFTPMWTSVMAVLNGRRLGLTTPAWVPLFIGFGSLALSVVNDVLLEVLVIDLALYFGAIILLWMLVLKPQQRAYTECHAGSARPLTGRWRWPVVSGLPLALVVVLCAVGLALPLQPREVCQRFSRAFSESELKQLTTNNFLLSLPGVIEVLRLPDKSVRWDVDWLEEGYAPPAIGGYVVWFRAVSVEKGTNVRVIGLFHLVERDHAWKIEDVYVFGINDDPFDPPISLARQYAQVKGGNDPPRNNGTARGDTKAPKKGDWISGETTVKLFGGVAKWLVSSGALKKIGLILGIAAIGLIRFGKGLVFRQPTPSAAMVETDHSPAPERGSRQLRGCSK